MPPTQGPITRRRHRWVVAETYLYAGGATGIAVVVAKRLTCAQCGATCSVGVPCMIDDSLFDAEIPAIYAEVCYLLPED